MHDSRTLPNRWPPPELTPWLEERYSCYESGDNRRQILRRSYVRTLVKTTFPGESDILTVDMIPGGFYTQVFACTASGDMAGWNIRITVRGGEILLGGPLLDGQLAPAAAPFDTVTIFGMATADGYSQQFPGSAGVLAPGEVLRWDPVIDLDGNQPLILEGSSRRSFLNLPPSRSVLHIAFHTWEFPDLTVKPGPQQAQAPRQEKK
jgi:hypothetical protein